MLPVFADSETSFQVGLMFPLEITTNFISIETANGPSPPPPPRQMPTFPRDWSPVVRREAGPAQSSLVATGRLDILVANSQLRNMLEWEDPTARSDELTKAGTER